MSGDGVLGDKIGVFRSQHRTHVVNIVPLHEISVRHAVVAMLTCSQKAVTYDIPLPGRIIPWGRLGRLPAARGEVIRTEWLNYQILLSSPMR